jgi:hypothetical protein
MFFDAFIILSIICGLAFAEIMNLARSFPAINHAVPLAPLLLCIWAIAQLGPSSVSAATHAKQLATGGEQEFKAGVDFLAAHPGPAICETLLMCFDAAKPFDYDPYYVGELLKTGHLTEAAFEENIRQSRYRVIQFERLYDPSPTHNGRLFFPAESLRVLREYYTNAFSTQNYEFWIPLESNPVSLGAALHSSNTFSSAR